MLKQILWVIFISHFLFSQYFFSIKPIPVNDRLTQKAYQYSTMELLMQGIYDGEQTIAKLKKQGNFGLGTFNGIDGEMVVLDGQFFRINGDGTVSTVRNASYTPFAIVTHYQPENIISLNQTIDLRSLQKKLRKQLLPDGFYFIRIDGSFSTIQTRSIARHFKPYPLLDTALKKQQIFSYQQIKGTLVGIYISNFTQHKNQPAFHFHFISHDKKAGGHVLDMTMQYGIISYDTKHSLEIEFSQSQLFHMAIFKNLYQFKKK